MPRLFRGRSRRWLAASVVLLVVSGGVGAWLLTRDTASEAAEATTSVVAAETVQETVAASGTIAAARTADLDFEVSGTVVSVFVEAGDRVRKGDRLAAVDTSALVAYRDAAAATLSAAYTQLEDDQDADASDLQLAADEAAIVSAEASLEAARQDVEDATLRATIAGTVVSLDVAVGDVVGASGGADLGAGAATTTTETTTSSAVSIVSANSYVVDATVSAADVARLEKGLQAEITPTGVTETVYGTVQSVGLVAETSSSGAAVFPVTIAVTGSPEELHAGTSAEVSIVVKQIEDVLTVPTRSLTTEDDTTYVTVVADGTETRTEVETGTTYGMSTEVVSGLSEGDTVVVPAFTPPTGGGGGGGEMQLPEGFTPPDFSQLPGGGQFEGPPQ